VFLEHTEFFRQSTTNRDNFSLILRRVVDKNEGVRAPVNEATLKMLIDTAITIHGKQFSQKVDRRWLATMFIPFLGGLIGALMGLAGALGAAWLKAG
jgi:VIT1/CCC1 family predicted Fe2+/Mn2+ transporter